MGEEPFVEAFRVKSLSSGEPLEVTATAYTAGYESTGKRPGDPGYGITKTGSVATPMRTIAVDPNIIPLGTWVYIYGYGIYRAEDTGGQIKGYRIDIFMNSYEQAVAFGVRRLRVYPLTNLF